MAPKVSCLETFTVTEDPESLALWVKKKFCMRVYETICKVEEFMLWRLLASPYELSKQFQNYLEEDASGAMRAKRHK